MARIRADMLMVAQGLCQTRSRARALILAGVVLEDAGARVKKPGDLLAEDLKLRLKHQAIPYVSRGGLKLEKALKHFSLSVQDQVAIDVGASTGGFSDCLLQHGARKIYAVDVGYGQLAWKLRQDDRVVVMERKNIRTLDDDALPELCDVMVIDVSFISLKIVIPAGLRFCRDGARVVGLVKPQFEVGKGDVGKGGIVRDVSARDRALSEICKAAEASGLVDIETTNSPIEGAKGNTEFLLSGIYRKPATNLL